MLNLGMFSSIYFFTLGSEGKNWNISDKKFHVQGFNSFFFFKFLEIQTEISMENHFTRKKFYDHIFL